MGSGPDLIDEYIRQNRGRYTTEAIRDQLVAAGHDRGAVDAALEPFAPPIATPTLAGWRPGWREFLVLVVLGAIGAAIVWASEPYGAGAIAPVVYAVLVSIGFGLAKLISLVIDRGSSGAASVLLGLVAIGTIYLAIINSFSPIALGVAAVALVLALLLLAFRGRNQRIAGMIGAALPLIVWLAITGTCYSPLFT